MCVPLTTVDIANDGTGNGAYAEPLLACARGMVKGALKESLQAHGVLKTSVLPAIKSINLEGSPDVVVVPPKRTGFRVSVTEGERFSALVKAGSTVVAWVSDDSDWVNKAFGLSLRVERFSAHIAPLTLHAEYAVGTVFALHQSPVSTSSAMYYSIQLDSLPEGARTIYTSGSRDTRGHVVLVSHGEGVLVLMAGRLDKFESHWQRLAQLAMICRTIPTPIKASSGT